MTMTSLGEFLLALSTFGALVSIVLLVLGHTAGPKQGEGMTNAGYFATFAVFGTTTASTLLLVVALFQKNFSFLYVVENHSTDVSGLAWLYNLSALWAGREGSLLFWAWLLSCFVAFMAWKRISFTDALSNIGIAILNFVQIFFLVALFFDSNNPFKVTPDGAVQAGKLVGQYATAGMNPLLQHWAMILHPPTLFIGYAGLAVPFAFALAAVFLGDSSKRWVEIVDRVTVFSWLSLGIGIGLGAIWAYVVLGWGGYWAWDPVENASLLPWLTGVALLHSFTVYRRRDGFKKWAVMMSAVTFVLVLLGTFITRSGVIQSVHAFQKDQLSLVWFLGMMVLGILVPAVALWFRRKQFVDSGELKSLASKEASYLVSNVIMLFAAVLVALLTLSPALNIWTPGGATIADAVAAASTAPVAVTGYVQPGSVVTTTTPNTFTLTTEVTQDNSADSISVVLNGALPAGVVEGTPLVVSGTVTNGTLVSTGIVVPQVIKGPTFSPATFDLLARPIGILYVLLMALCPILSWGVTDRETFWKRAKWPLGIAAVLGVGLLAIWTAYMLPYYMGPTAGLPGLANVQGPLDHVESIIGLLVAALAIALPTYLFVDGSRKRAASRGESPVTSFFHILFKSRTQSGGYLTHLGVGIVLIGLVGSTMYVKTEVVTLQEVAGSKATVGGYDFVYRDFSSQTLANGDVVQTIKLDLMQNGKVINHLAPSQLQVANLGAQGTRTNAAVDVGLFRDVFVALQYADTSGMTFEVKINPMISWAWVGFVLMIFGTAVAAWPKPPRELVAVAAPVKKKK
jgi:cytochrome c biogenesis factor